MSKERLDQILVRKGLVTEEQVRQALMRQKSHGGLLGSHLLYYRFLPEDQLVKALGEILGVPGIALSGCEVPVEVTEKLPKGFVEEQIVFPFRFDPQILTLSVALLDPENQMMLSQLKQAARVRDVKVHVAVESVLRNAIQVHYRGVSWDQPTAQVVELPELFAGEKAEDTEQEQPVEQIQSEGSPKVRKVLMITQAGVLKNFLPPIFEREGFNLRILADPEEIPAAMQENPADHILVSGPMEAPFFSWVSNSDMPELRSVATVFSGISNALMDNPVPYDRMRESLMQALQLGAEHRCLDGAWTPPYGLICQDISDLAQSLGLRSVAGDGLQMTALLLTPARDAFNSDGTQRIALSLDFFGEFNNSLEMARAISLPWEVEGCLLAFLQLLSGKALGSSVTENPELHMGVQILTAVWYRHSSFARATESQGDLFEKLKVSLRKMEERIFAPELVATYIRLIEKQKKPFFGAQKDVFVISDHNETSQQLSLHLRQAGYRVVEIRELAEAQHLYERKRPETIIINYDAYPDQAVKFCRFVKQDLRTPLYTFTAKNTPALTLTLLDSGCTDVFMPPFNYDIITTRINNALAGLAQQDSQAARRQDFSGTFRELPFVDLMQAIGLSQRSVRVLLEHESGARAEIYLREGLMTNAKAGNLISDEAVFHVISWRDNGSFRLEPVSEYPPDNISSPNDYILMEGCRLLDEGTG